jgi:hypothetical protein
MSIIRARCLIAIVAIGLLGASVTILGQGKKLTTTEAKNHIGEQATVCGRQGGGWALRRNHTRQADFSRPGQALSRPTVHCTDLGRESRQIRNARGNISKQDHLRYRADTILSRRTGNHRF